MAPNRRPTKALEHAHLDLLRPEAHEAVEPGGKAFQGLARQPGDEVRVHMHPRLFAQKAEVVLQPAKILPPVDRRCHDRIKRLDADLKLQGSGRKARDQFAQARRQPVGDHLEMQKQPGLEPVQKELQDLAPGLR